MVSLPQFCDHSCERLLTKDSLHVVKGGNFILDPKQPGTQVLYGTRNKKDRLWDIPIPQITPHSPKKQHLNSFTSATMPFTLTM